MEHPPAPQETLRHGVGVTRICSKCGQKVARSLTRCPLDGAPLLSAEAIARVGTRVGDYELKSVIGEGGTGVVYRGYRATDDSQVALKVLHAHLARQKDLVEPFIDDVRATSGIRHAHLTEVTDLGTTPGGTVFVATEYLEGESLQDRLRQSVRVPLFEAINILRQAARGVGAAHEAGIVHGGIKPSNIFLCTRKGRRRIVRRSKAIGMRLMVEPEDSFDLVKLLDFGVARLIDLSSGASVVADDLVGTAQYLSPEQVQGQPADQRSDIYALGAVLYEMVTGTVPFGREWLADALRGQISDVVVAPSRRTPRAGIDARIDALVLRCLKKNPALRFASTDELCETLDTCVTDCAFLRDAHRLPGIQASGIDLSEALPEARQEPAQVAAHPSEAPAATPLPAAPVERPPAPAALVERTKTAPAAEPAPTTPVGKPPGRPLLALQPPVAPVVGQPAPAGVVSKPGRRKADPTPAADAVVVKPAAAPVADKPAAPASPPPAAATGTPSEVAAKSGAPAAAMRASLPRLAPITADPFGAVVTPPPAPASAEDPAASLVTPLPVSVGANLHDQIATAIADEVSLRAVERGDPIASGLTERPSHLDVPDDVSRRRREAGRSPRSRAVAWTGVLLLGGTAAALWATQDDWAPSLTNPLIAALGGTATGPTPPAPSVAARAPSPQAPSVPATPPIAPPAAAAPVAPAMPAPVAPATPAPVPILGQAPAPAASPAAPVPPAAAAPAVAPPQPERAEPAEAPGTRIRGPAKAAPSRGRHAQARNPVRRALEIPMPFENLPAAEPETAPAAPPQPPTRSEPQPEPESRAWNKASEPETPAPNQAAAEPPPAPRATATDLIRDAQAARARGHLAVAVGKAEEALEAGPTPAQAVQAYELIGLCSCAIRDSETARSAASHLSDAKRETVRAACEKRGLTIE